MMVFQAAPSIIATCKQSRFHFLDDQPSRELDIQGLTILVTSESQSSSYVENPTLTSTASVLGSRLPSSVSATSTKTTKTRKLTENPGHELISNADLKVKPGIHYALVGKNGSGKSTILRAIAEKLIPGISHTTRIAILQQTENDHIDVGNDSGGSADGLTKGVSALTLCGGRTNGGDQTRDRKNCNNENNNGCRTVLQQVLASDEARNELLRNIQVLSKSLESEDPLEPILAVRRLRHERLQKQLFLAQKNASLRSGARGLQARKELKIVEAKVEASLERLAPDKSQIDTESITNETQEAVSLLEDLQSQHESIQAIDFELQARKTLIGLGFKEEMLDQAFNTFSGGWQMRCKLAGVLIQNPDIMILDEPTNFLDLLGVMWLEKYLRRMKETSEITLLLVSHDRDFVNAVCEELILLRDKNISYFRGNLSAYEEDFESQKLYWTRMKESQEKQIAHMESTVRENIKAGKKSGDDNKLRQAKSRQKKLEDRMGIQVSAKGTKFKLNRDLVGWHHSSRAEIEVPTDEKAVSLNFPDAPDLRFPGPLLSLESIVFAYKKKDPPILNDINLVIHVGDRVGIMGLNGCGKSTFLQILTGAIEPSKGKVTRHPRLKLGYYAQTSVSDLQKQGQSDNTLTALSLMLKEVGNALGEGEVRRLLGSIGLAGRLVSDVPVSRLSGGQLARLAMAKILWNPPHMLVLDEITTHLDFHTVTALVSALSTFSGAIVIVSHDRFLIRSVIEGKRDHNARLDEEFEGVDEEPEASMLRRRVVYAMKRGTLNEQNDGAEQFERSLEKRVNKMLAS